MKLLLVVDLQKEFINENTEWLPDKIKGLIDSKVYDDVIFTRFINKEDSIFVSKLNWRGCLDSEDIKVVIDTKDYLVINKEIYSSVCEELIGYIKKNNITDIYVCGIDTECCVLKTAFDLFELKYNTYVLKDYCACTHGQAKHDNAIECLKRNIGKQYII